VGDYSHGLFLPQTAANKKPALLSPDKGADFLAASAALRLFPDIFYPGIIGLAFQSRRPRWMHIFGFGEFVNLVFHINWDG